MSYFLKPDQSPEVVAFLAEIVEVCRKHGLSIAHEDIGGAFQVTPFDEHIAGWLSAASDETTPQR